MGIARVRVYELVDRKNELISNNTSKTKEAKDKSLFHQVYFLVIIAQLAVCLLCSRGSGTVSYSLYHRFALPSELLCSSLVNCLVLFEEHETFFVLLHCLDFGFKRVWSDFFLWKSLFLTAFEISDKVSFKDFVITSFEYSFFFLLSFLLFSLSAFAFGYFSPTFVQVKIRDSYYYYDELSSVQDS